MPTVKTVTRHPRLEAFFLRTLMTIRREPIFSLTVTVVHFCFALVPSLLDWSLDWSLGFWAYLFPPVSLFLLLWRLSYTEYKGTPFKKLTLVQLDEYEGGEMQVALNCYRPPAAMETGYGRFENAL
jgi:hypothetical protein